jgi:hypothetical protein
MFTSEPNWVIILLFQNICEDGLKLLLTIIFSLWWHLINVAGVCRRFKWPIAANTVNFKWITPIYLSAVLSIITKTWFGSGK